MTDCKERVLQSRKQLSSLGEIHSRSQFGGYSLSIGKVVFALVSQGELYLRACEQIKSYITERRVPPLVLNKKGMNITLDYYRVDETLWNDPNRLLYYSQHSLKYAQQQKHEKANNLRLKDLPNMGIRMEMLLREAGIDNVEEFRKIGAKECWLKLRKFNNKPGLETLYALEGALLGYHRVVLPNEIRLELQHWFESISKNIY